MTLEPSVSQIHPISSSDPKSSPNPPSFPDKSESLSVEKRRGLNTSISHNLHSLTLNPLSTPFSDPKSSPNPLL
jgi:hypothetical protein